ncbi:hypothetical protein AYY17_08590 [Morganella psychrotolerans]|uniref:DUF1460 domain-containing protein n=1 Tax=Morganella psychrotolerans TaxID=368603 RepID=A0A1B8H793_9GAMM|nr:N-acetylmuramoyl-L-alanine amidase-like domain-containing protein [Morganella psychrotolerans]OBU04933.1 hypothetical protein AYY17_08590 [Morganella psychrotolerans]
MFLCNKYPAITALLVTLWSGIAGAAVSLSDFYQPDGTRRVITYNITALTGQFLAVPYRAHQLIGSPETPEQLVINLNALDCFTYLDYVEALKRSPQQQDFPGQLAQIRYKNGDISYFQRRHFFSDWVSGSQPVAQDITRQLSADFQVTHKLLNQRKAGGAYIPGLPVTARDIAWLPVSALTPMVLAQLQTGDYIGIYSPQDGLDVSHAGIIIRTPDGLFLRNASSTRRERQVIDSPLHLYLRQKSGIVVYRAVL